MVAAVFFAGLALLILLSVNRSSFGFYQVLVVQLPLSALGFGWTAAFLFRVRAVVSGDHIDGWALPGWRRTANIGSLLILVVAVVFALIFMVYPLINGVPESAASPLFQVPGLIVGCIFGDLPRSVVRKLERDSDQARSRGGWPGP
ncbi:hypothetical protein N8J89_35315 [Crossiella sp. CA-258035]|uniref:hypothetical protein n=1 Tax=Crossiella sp. CA-258035 TaxID=2981138 RepID=UPI0024BC0FA6|nr:hypothetical protein [Crossiella sp. CA-258035]WHT18327.1 hypothetical protein N8J89_35315 [Crossiella sp. CA-258035]